MKTNDGGPAFPATIEAPFYVTHEDGSVRNEGTAPYDAPGMSLRDWFAGQALAGLVSSQNTNIEAADAAYACAEAMIYEREKRDGE